MIGRISNVARVTDWLFAGVSYSVYVGLAGAIQGWMVLSALGPALGYRSVAVSANEASRALSTVFATEDPAARTDSAECLLGLRDVLLPTAPRCAADPG